MRRSSAAVHVGWLALTFSALHSVSDLIEAIQGGFSTGQLWLTFVAEAAVPFVVIEVQAMWPAMLRGSTTSTLWHRSGGSSAPASPSWPQALTPSQTEERAWPSAPTS